MPLLDTLQRCRYVDTHCHVDLFSNPDATLLSAAAQSVAVVAMTNAPSVFEATRRLCKEHDNCIPSLGLHPELAHERQAEMPLFRSLLDTTEVIGEIGLDRMRSTSHAAAQRAVFNEILSMCNTTHRKVLSVHSRGSAGEVIALLRSSFTGGVIMHWYSGTKALARESIAAGYYFSFNRSMLQSLAGRELLKVVPRELILTESDGPFGAVTGTPNVPADIPRLVEEIAGILQVEAEQMRQQIYDNFNRVVTNG